MTLFIRKGHGRHGGLRLLHWRRRRVERVRFVSVVEAVCHVGFRIIKARHGFRPVEVDAAHVGFQRNGFRHGRDAERLNGFILVQRAAKFRGAAFAVVGRGPVPHVVGVLGVAVVKHGIVRPQVVGRQVGQAARGFERVVQQRMRGRGHGVGRQREPLHPAVLGFGAQLQPVAHDHEC